jgi:hypothetical protein
MKWISVKDQLPKKGEWVLLFDGEEYLIGKIPSGKIPSGASNTNFHEWYLNCCTSCCFSFGEVTHWSRFKECS